MHTHTHTTLYTMDEFIQRVKRAASKERFTGQDYECADLHMAAVRYGHEIDALNDALNMIASHPDGATCGELVQLAESYRTQIKTLRSGITRCAKQAYDLIMENV